MRPFAALLACLLAACRTAPSSRPPEPAPAPRLPPAPLAQPSAQSAVLLARLGDTAVLALGMPGFSALPQEERLLAYWLVQAAAAGDAIAWDQSYRHNLEVVRLLRGILTHPQAVQPALLGRLRDYARAIYLSHGLHDPDTGRKILPPFTPAELRQAALAAQAAGAELGRADRLELALRALDGPVFDPAVDSLRTARVGPDPLTASAVNLYSGVTLRDLTGFRDRYPLNSRLVREDGRLVEQVERAGGSGAAPGLHADRLARVAAALEQAQPYARSAPQRRSLELLALYFRTGEPDRFREAQREWVKDAPRVDGVLGFIESYADPRGVKALFEGFVGALDAGRSELLQRLADNAQYYEDQKPWAQEWRRKDVQAPRVSALAVLGASGENRPQGFIGVNLPNEQDERDRFGSKSFLLPGYDDAIAAVRTAAVAGEFSPPHLAEGLLRCHAQHRFAQIAFHEVVGHASGKVSSALKGDPAAVLGASYNTLEEARADLVAHWHALDPRTREIGLIADAGCQELYPQFATTSWFTFAAGVPQGERIEEDHLRANQLMIWWFTGKGAIAERRTSGKRYLVVTDRAKWRAAAGELLSLLQHIKATGHAARLHDLVDLHASRLDVEWRDEVIGRLRALGIPRRVRALPPLLRAVLADGKVVDATAEAVEDLDAQLLRDWSIF